MQRKLKFEFKEHAINLKFQHLYKCVNKKCSLAVPAPSVFVTHINMPLSPMITVKQWVTRWRSWLRHCATSRKVAGSIPDGVIGIFH